jgi:hypothetical protein
MMPWLDFTPDAKNRLYEQQRRRYAWDIAAIIIGVILLGIAVNYWR